MATVLKEVVRWVPRCNLTCEPMAQRVDVRLVEYPTGAVCIVTPWACLGSDRDAPDYALVGSLGTSFATEAEALAHLTITHPHYSRPQNDEVREKLLKCREWHGSIVGDARLRDELGVSLDRLHSLALGVAMATRNEGRVAAAYTGGPAR
jgi:hypothetical protein